MLDNHDVSHCIKPPQPGPQRPGAGAHGGDADAAWHSVIDHGDEIGMEDVPIPYAAPLPVGNVTLPLRPFEGVIVGLDGRNHTEGKVAVGDLQESYLLTCSRAGSERRSPRVPGWDRPRIRVDLPAHPN